MNDSADFSTVCRNLPHYRLVDVVASQIYSDIVLVPQYTCGKEFPRDLSRKYGPLPKTVPGTGNSSKTSSCGLVSDVLNGPLVPKPKLNPNPNPKPKPKP